MRRFSFSGMILLLAGGISLAVSPAAGAKIRAVILTGQHSYPKEFWDNFDSMADLQYIHVDLPDHSEIFEDISAWNYDVIIMHNSGQRISGKREQNFLTLLQRGVGLVVIHHAVCAYEDWPEFRKIEGTKFYGAAEVYEGKRYESNYIEPTSIKVVIDDKANPLMQGFADFTITDEVYTDMSYEKDNHVLAHTTHASVPGAPLVWTRRYANSNVFVITLGHRAATLNGPFMSAVVPRAIRWAVSEPSAVVLPARPKGGHGESSRPISGYFLTAPGEDAHRDARGRLSPPVP